jgi:hypothetical protein
VAYQTSESSTDGKTMAEAAQRELISVPGWKLALTGSGEPVDRQQGFAWEIISF